MSEIILPPGCQNETAEAKPAPEPGKHVLLGRYNLDTGAMFSGGNCLDNQSVSSLLIKRVLAAKEHAQGKAWDGFEKEVTLEVSWVPELDPKAERVQVALYVPEDRKFMPAEREMVADYIAEMLKSYIAQRFAMKQLQAQASKVQVAPPSFDSVLAGEIRSRNGHGRKR